MVRSVATPRVDHEAPWMRGHIRPSMKMLLNWALQPSFGRPIAVYRRRDVACQVDLARFGDFLARSIAVIALP